MARGRNGGKRSLPKATCADPPQGWRGCLSHLEWQSGITAIRIKSIKGYLLDSFSDAFARYLPSEAANAAESGNTGDKH